MTLTATVSPLLVGTTIAAYEGIFHLMTFLPHFSRASAYKLAQTTSMNILITAMGWTMQDHWGQ